MANPLKDDDRREPDAEPERGEHNRIGYYNADEQREHDERGSQSPGPGEPPPEDA
ncbi:hypothetical protein DVA67_004310 [Solirubrobacter sp. CPCC 204708]|uniref:Uncharacterized protein n=1 Tax=Solirubrobacter deserti TaxID=2282478 RepID=A0ABT4RH70_9ACTN|nr:hypothetical protein [Solirubrobacter deserti]MBE2315184.1 hypothetical protein [Solirubrobacter deserti]MDA0137867.1 hypothetical protein [Solirubrobacter deserti]